MLTKPSIRAGRAMSDKIAGFLREVGLQNASSGTWGIGSVIARASAKATQSLMNVTVKSAEDQFVISANRENALPIISDALTKISYGLKDPALFGIPTATFCVYMAFQAFGRMNAPCLVFITLRAVLETSTHVSIEGRTIEALNNKGAASWVKKVRDAITAKFPSADATEPVTSEDAATIKILIAKVVPAYGEIMEKWPNAILPAARLPLPKEEMKTALRLAYRIQKEPTLRQFVEVAYTHLCQFRDDISSPIDPTLTKDKSPSEAIAILEPFLAIADSVEAERTKLLAEFAEYRAFMEARGR